MSRCVRGVVLCIDIADNFTKPSFLSVFSPKRDVDKLCSLISFFSQFTNERNSSMSPPDKVSHFLLCDPTALCSYSIF